MGHLESLLMYDDFDFQVLFDTLLKTHYGMDHLARLACACKLSRAWIRHQLVKCNQDQLYTFLAFMRCTGLEEGFAKERRELPPVGQLLYVKHLFYGPQFDCTFERVVGFADIRALRSFDSDPIEWIARRCATSVEDKKIIIFSRRYTSSPLRYGFACFPIFDEQVRRVLAPEKFVSDDERVLKKARMDRGSSLTQGKSLNQ
jgi:hypothetical protein